MGSLLASLQNLAASVLAILQTRFELLTVEVEEEWLRLIGFIAIGLIGLFCAGMAIVLLTGLIVALFWDTYRMPAIAILAAIFAVASAWLWRDMLLRFPAKPPFLFATIQEIQKDIQQLRETDDEIQ